MAYTEQDLINAGLPLDRIDPDGGVYFTRSLTTEENQLFLTFADPALARAMQARFEANEIPFWSIWTYEQLDTWCDNNLMTDAQIDALTLNANLKTNLKANNAFVRNAGKMLIALRNHTRIIE